MLLGKVCSCAHEEAGVMKRSLTREQLATILSGLLCIALFVVVLQLWLLTAAVGAQLGDDGSVAWPAAFASLACCALNVALFRYLGVLERSRQEEPVA
jgi:hypothetical protein